MTMAQQNTFHVDAFWDAEVAVWVATSDDIPGLATEANSLDALQLKLRAMVPELLLLNQVFHADRRGTN